MRRNAERKENPIFVYLIETTEGQFLGYSVHVNEKWHDFPANAESFPEGFMEACVFSLTRREGMPSIETMDSLMQTLQRILSGLRSSGASCHDVNRLYVNLKTSKEQLERQERLGPAVQGALRWIEEAGDFIASYRSPSEKP